MNYWPSTEQLTARLVEFLARANPPKSHGVVIPPGFGSSEFPITLRRRLLANNPAQLVAAVSADGLHTPADLVHSLAEAWRKQGADLHTDEGTDARIQFSRLLDAIDPARRPVQIICEFHKILGKLDESILVALRDAEQAGRVQTVTASIFPYVWIREKWKKEGHLLHVSNYGDSHKTWHIERQNQDSFLRHPSILQLPGWFRVLLWELTAGFPLPVQQLIDKWQEHGLPSTPSVALEAELRQEAIGAFRRLAENLDTPGESRFRELLLDIHQHRPEADDTVRRFRRFHPWAQVILDGEGLCTDSIGEAVLSSKLEQLFRKDEDEDFEDQVVAHARDHYMRGQYQTAFAVLDHAPRGDWPVEAQLLRLNCEVMAALWPSGQKPCLDTDWMKVAEKVKDAFGALDNLLPEGLLRETLRQRYEEVARLAGSVLRLQKAKVTRVVDTLAGLRGSPNDMNAAFTLLVLQYDAGAAIPGNTMACKAVLELPEQVLRCWAYWKHAVNFYAAPEISDDDASRIRALWPERLGQPILPKKGTPFSSVLAFSYYLQAIAEPPPWSDVPSLERSLSVFDLRNDPAHAVSVMDARCRAKLFNFVEEWLNRIEDECKAVTVSISAARSIVEPFPLRD